MYHQPALAKQGDRVATASMQLARAMALIPRDKLAPVDDPKRPTPSHARGEHRRTAQIFDWLFRNRQTGQVTVAEFPNVALWIFLLTVALRQFVSTGTDARTAIDWIGAVALAWWALDEVFRGVNPWRRLLGFVGCIFVAAVLVSLLR